MMSLANINDYVQRVVRGIVSAGVSLCWVVVVGIVQPVSAGKHRATKSYIELSLGRSKGFGGLRTWRNVTVSIFEVGKQEV